MDLRNLSALALAVGLLAGCGSDSAPPTSIDSGYGLPAEGTSTAPAEGTSTTPAEAEVVMVISEFAFQTPESVPAGATITVRNEDDMGHTVTSDDNGASFDVAVGPGEEVTFTAPEEAGEFPFHCRPHPNMTGTLVVEG